MVMEKGKKCRAARFAKREEEFGGSKAHLKLEFSRGTQHTESSTDKSVREKRAGSEGR